MKRRYHWQGFLLALLLAAAAPLCFLWLRIGLLSRSTGILADPLLLGLALLAGIGGCLLTRRSRLLPLCAAAAWLLWFLLPTGNGSLTVQLMLAGVFRAGLVETVSSVVLWTAFLWSFLSVPAVAEFLTELLPERRRAGI